MMKKLNSVSIFVSYHDRHKLIKSDILIPIQTGRAITDESFDNMIGDDTGDNISTENSKYNELSAQYWVWKNYQEIGSPEYVGFMHYRRHFVFDKSLCIQNLTPWFKNMHVYLVNCFTQRCLRNLSGKNILDTISDKADCYAIKPYDISYFEPNQLRSIKEHYLETIPGAKEVVWDAFYKILHKLYPQYSNIIDDFCFGSILNPCNMFLMRKELFFEYNDFCFSVLKEVDHAIDSSKFNEQEQRFLGYLGEYLMTLFVMILQTRGLHIHYLDALLFEDIDSITFHKKNVKSEKKLTLLQKIFSIKNTFDKRHKVITILGIKIKIKKK